MRTDSPAVEEIIEIDERDARPTTRAPLALLREAPAPTPLTDDELREVRRRHLAFKQTGRGRDAGLRPAGDVVPISLHPYLDIDRLRGDYPICIFKDPGHGILPLTKVIDRSLDSLELEGDDLERCRRRALQLEARIRELAAEESDPILFKLWNIGSEDLSGRYRDDPERQKRLHDDLAMVRKHIPSDAQLVGCGRETARHLLEAARHRMNAPGGRKADDEIRDILQRLDDLLALEDEESDAGLAPGHLRDSVGEGFQSDLDFQALSNLLHDAPHAESLTPSRRARIESIVETLKAHLERIGEQGRATVSLPDSTSLIEYVRQRLEEEALVSRMLIAARLENSGRFDEERHATLLSEDASGRWGQPQSIHTPLPPIHLDFRGVISAQDQANLAELFDREIPVKVLVTLGNCIDGTDEGAAEPYLPASFGERLLLSGPLNGFLCQRSLADAGRLVDTMTDFLGCEKTAVLIVYDGASFGDDVLHPYLKSAAAVEARVVPAFRCDGGKGTDWARRFSIEGNEQPEETWPRTTVEFTTANGESQVRDSGFTAASLLLCEPAFSDHFRLVDRNEWHDGLIPIEEYDGDARHVPYLLAASTDGIIHRVIVSEYVWRQMHRVGARWHGLRELGGVMNSHAARAVADAAEQLETEHRDRLAKLESEHRAALESTTGRLAEEIVANIAAGLLDEASTGPLPPISHPSTPRKAVPEITEEDPEESAATVEQPEPEPVDDDFEIIDEAYVETPRCTTCDECTTINPRMFSYNENKQAYIADLSAGTYRDLVLAAEKCPVRIIHPGKPLNPDEPHLDELVKRAEPFR